MRCEARCECCAAWQAGWTRQTCKQKEHTSSLEQLPLVPLDADGTTLPANGPAAAPTMGRPGR